MAKVSIGRINIMTRRPAVLMGVAVLMASCVGNESAADPPLHKPAFDVGTIEGVVIYESDRQRPWRYRRYYVADSKKGHLAEAVVSLAAQPQVALAVKAEPRSWAIDQQD